MLRNVPDSERMLYVLALDNNNSNGEILLKTPFVHMSHYAQTLLMSRVFKRDCVEYDCHYSRAITYVQNATRFIDV